MTHEFYEATVDRYGIKEYRFGCPREYHVYSKFGDDAEFQGAIVKKMEGGKTLVWGIGITSDGNFEDKKGVISRSLSAYSLKDIDELPWDVQMYISINLSPEEINKKIVGDSFVIKDNGVRLTSLGESLLKRFIPGKRLLRE